MTERAKLRTPAGVEIEVKAEKVDTYLAAGFVLAGEATTSSEPDALPPMKDEPQPTREATPEEKSDAAVRRPRRSKQ